MQISTCSQLNVPGVSHPSPADAARVLSCQNNFRRMPRCTASVMQQSFPVTQLYVQTRIATASRTGAGAGAARSIARFADCMMKHPGASQLISLRELNTTHLLHAPAVVVRPSSKCRGRMTASQGHAKVQYLRYALTPCPQLCSNNS